MLSRLKSPRTIRLWFQSLDRSAQALIHCAKAVTSWEPLRGVLTPEDVHRPEGDSVSRAPFLTDDFVRKPD